MKFNKYLLFFFLIFFVYSDTVFAQTDTVSVDLSQDVRLSILSASFGFVVRASSTSNTQLDVDPLVTLGPRYRLLVKRTWGFNGYLLFSTEGDKTYVMPAVGLSLKGTNKLAFGQEHQVALGYYTGEVSGDFEHGWVERLRLLFTFPLR